MVIEFKKRNEKVEIERELEHLESSSGEVFYIKNGVLQKAENRDAYNKVIEDYIYQQELHNHLNSIFYIEDNKIRYGYLLKYENQILEHIAKLGNTQKQIEYVKAYHKAYSNFPYRNDTKGGKTE